MFIISTRHLNLPDNHEDPNKRSFHIFFTRDNELVIISAGATIAFIYTFQSSSNTHRTH